MPPVLPSACSVLANNDVPTGAARIPLEAALPADWEGWGDPAIDGAELDAQLAVAAPPRPKRVRTMPRRPRPAAPKRTSSSGTTSDDEQSPRPAKAHSAAEARQAAAAAAAEAAAAGGGSFHSLHSLGRSGSLLPARSLPEQGSAPRVLVMSQSAWEAQKQQMAAMEGVRTIHLDRKRSSSGKATRSFSIPSMSAEGARPQSHWQLQQQRMAAAGSCGDAAAGDAAAGASPLLASFASARSSGVGADRFGGQAAAMQPPPLSHRSAGQPSDLSPFALAAAQASQATTEGGSGAWPHTASHHLPVAVPLGSRRSASGAIASPVAEAACATAAGCSPRAGQDWVAYAPQLPLPAPQQLGDSEASTAVTFPGGAFTDRAAMLQQQVEAGSFGPTMAALPVRCWGRPWTAHLHVAFAPGHARQPCARSCRSAGLLVA